jgi:hypothetical protein
MDEYDYSRTHGPLLAAVLALSVVAQPGCDTRTMFFPPGVLSELQAQWYGRHLARMGEPSLVCAPADVGHLPLYVASYVGAPGNSPANHVAGAQRYRSQATRRVRGVRSWEARRATLTDAQVKDFQALFGKLGFTKMAADDPHRGLDGSEWILEAVENGNYHIAVRWTPHEYDTAKRGLTEFVRVCEWLYRASPLRGDAKNKGFVEMEKSPKAGK